MPTFEIVNVQSAVRDWDSTKGGPMKSYRVDLKDEAGELRPSVEWARKASSPAPTVGEKLDGTVENTDYGLKIKVAPSGGFGGGGGRNDPKTSAQIIQQHSQAQALRYCELQHARGKLPDDFTFEQVLKIAAKFAADAKAAKP